MQTPFEQNVIAVIWDFDKTLIPGNMQKPIFEHYNIRERDFWAENNQLPEKYKKMNAGMRVHQDSIYLNHF